MRAETLRIARQPENLLLLGFFAVGALQTWILASHDQEFSGRTTFIYQFTLSALIGYWVMCDSARRGIPRPFVFGLLLFIFWPILAPWHVFKTRGWRGFATVGMFVGLYLLCFGLPYAAFALR
jgi:hypothetical protein